MNLCRLNEVTKLIPHPPVDPGLPSSAPQIEGSILSARYFSNCESDRPFHVTSLPTQTDPQVSSRSPEPDVIERHNMTSNTTPLDAAMSPRIQLN